MTVRASRSVSKAEFEAHKHPAMACSETQSDGIVSPRHGRTSMLDFRFFKKKERQRGYEHRTMKWLQWELSAPFGHIRVPGKTDLTSTTTTIREGGRTEC